MNSRWATVIAASLVAFASLVITWQIRHYAEPQSLSQAVFRGEQLAMISDISKRDGQINEASGSERHLDLVLPEDARIFMTDMTGPTNYTKLGYYYFVTYYLFPREIGVSLDQPARQTKDGFLGRTSESDQEILSHGFDVRMDMIPGENMVSRSLHIIPIRDPVNPDWFDSYFDLVIAFLLPLLTALAGLWLFRWLFSTLSVQMPLREQLAYGLGLGMMAVAALTLGIKLCGFHGREMILAVTAVGGSAEMWHDRKVFLSGISDGFRKLIHSPIAAAVFLAGLLVFLILFRLAGLQGITEYDAVMAWMLKAKIIHLYTGNELLQWFSCPRLTHAHLDYPTLMPSLHAATYDSIGHVDEFVTKFWPTWMLLFLIGALASVNRATSNWRHVVSFALLGLLLLPATQRFVQCEGGTLPMIFFTVLGFVQCAFWLARKDRARLGLGLTLLFGAAMTKFEGFIFLALVVSWLLLLPSARPPLKLLPRFWRSTAFCLLSALPFVCLRLQIPTLNDESSRAGHILQHPTILFSTLSDWGRLFIIELTRLFMNPDFANWSGEGGQMRWIGRWDGFSSLYNHTTLGLAWVCSFLALALWLAIPARRQVVVWTLAMFVGATVALSGVFSTFAGAQGLSTVIGYTNEETGGRYLMPVLLAWFATVMTLFFSELSSASAADRKRLPELKHGYWLAVGALLIVALGVFVPPKNESSAPENPLASTTAASSLNSSEYNSSNNDDVQTRTALAMQLDKAGKFAEAIQAYREIVRDHPDDPIALNNLAWNLAANPRPGLRNGKEAVELAGKAVKLTGQQEPVLLGTLAAAYAEAGQFAQAVEMARQARNVALLNVHPEIAAKNEQLLKLYSAGKAIGSTNGP